MCLRSQSNIFPFFDQSNSDVSLVNSGFNNFCFSSDTNIFPDENLKSFFTKCNSIETPFNDSDHSVSIDSKHFEDLRNFLSLLKHSYDIIGVSQHKITKGSKNSAFNLPGYIFCFNETETSHGGTSFLVSNNLTYKLRPDLFINEHGGLESTVIELTFPNKKNIISVVPYISILV